MSFQVRRRGRLRTPAWTESPVAPTVCSLSNWLRLLLMQMATTFSRSVETNSCSDDLWEPVLILKYFLILFVRIKTKWLLVSCAWWTWQEVSALVGQGQKAPAYVKQVCYPKHQNLVLFKAEVHVKLNILTLQVTLISLCWICGRASRYLEKTRCVAQTGYELPD